MNEKLSLLPTLEAAKVTLQLQNKELYQQLYENREKYKLIAQQVREFDYQNTLEKATLVETIKNIQLSHSQLLLVCLPSFLSYLSNICMTINNLILFKY